MGRRDAVSSRRHDPPGSPAHPAGLRGVPAHRLALGPPAPLPDLRPRRLLRLVAEPPRAPARPHRRPPDRALVPAGRGLALVLRGRDVRLTPRLRRLPAVLSPRP